MRQSWIAVLGLVLAFCVLVGASAAAAEEPSSGAEEAVPAAEEPTSDTEEAAAATEESSLSSEGAAPALLLDEGCASGHACVWTEYNFQGAKGESLCTGGAHGLAGYKQSGKNRCANKSVWFRSSGTQHYCLEPNKNENYFFYLIDEIWVGAEGSHC